MTPHPRNQHTAMHTRTPSEAITDGVRSLAFWKRETASELPTQKDTLEG